MPCSAFFSPSPARRARHRSVSQALLAGLALLVPFRVNHAREGILPPPRDGVAAGDEHGQEHAGGFPPPQGGGQEAQRGAVVHGRVGHVEGEARDGRVHQDAEVVAQIRARHAEGPHGGQDEGGAGREERERGEVDEGPVEGGVRRLVGEGGVVAGKEGVSGVRKDGAGKGGRVQSREFCLR